MYDHKAIRKTLEDYGWEVYSVRKERRYYGGTRYHTARGQWHVSSGTPEWFFKVELLHLDNVDDDDYALAKEVLKDAGYKSVSLNLSEGLRVWLPRDMQREHQARLKH